MSIFLAFSLQDALVSERRCRGRPDITVSFESNDTLWKLIILSSLQTDLRCMQQTANQGQAQRVHNMHFVHTKCGNWVFFRWAISNTHIFRIFHTLDEFSQNIVQINFK